MAGSNRSLRYRDLVNTWYSCNELPAGSTVTFTSLPSRTSTSIAGLPVQSMRAWTRWEPAGTLTTSWLPRLIFPTSSPSTLMLYWRAISRQIPLGRTIEIRPAMATPALPVLGAHRWRRWVDPIERLRTAQPHDVSSTPRGPRGRVCGGGSGCFVVVVVGGRARLVG